VFKFFTEPVASHVLQPLTWGVPILVAFDDMHGLQWEYYFPRSPHGDYMKHQASKLKVLVLPPPQKFVILMVGNPYE
jgi:hypothetical protein